ncbi:MAG TPA: flagellar FlbD family protein [Acidimicrobiales bacterium]|jgi:flagellar protein FlbD
MIVVHNVRGEPFALNALLIERVEGGAETHVLLVDGSRYVVIESIDDVVGLVRNDRAEVEAAARRLAARASVAQHSASDPDSGLRLIRDDGLADGDLR